MISIQTYVYEEIVNFIRNRIERGLYKNMERIPSENEMAKVFGVQRNTIRKAISILLDEGILKTVPGKGTYVIQKKKEIQLVEKYTTIRNDDENTGIIYQKIRIIGDYYAKIFNLSADDLMYANCIVRYTKGIPYILEKIYIPVQWIENFENFDLKVFDTSDIFSIRDLDIYKINQKLYLVETTPRIEKYLKIKNTSVIKVEKKSYINKTNCIEYREQYIRGEFINITNFFDKERDV